VHTSPSQGAKQSIVSAKAVRNKRAKTAAALNMLLKDLFYINGHAFDCLDRAKTCEGSAGEKKCGKSTRLQKESVSLLLTC
jgi:hypothetical protein